MKSERETPVLLSNRARTRRWVDTKGPVVVLGSIRAFGVVIVALGATMVVTVLPQIDNKSLETS